MKTFFGCHPKHDLCGKKYSHKQFREIRAKIFNIPKNLPAAPMPFTYVLQRSTALLTAA